jgi:hypothetical protein
MTMSVYTHNKSTVTPQTVEHVDIAYNVND